MAFVQGERGTDVVESALEEGGACGAVNWSEMAQRVLAHGRSWDLVSGLVRSYGITVEPVTMADGEWAARRWRRGEGLSLADRLCLALGERLDATVWTADQLWGSSTRVRQIR